MVLDWEGFDNSEIAHLSGRMSLLRNSFFIIKNRNLLERVGGFIAFRFKLRKRYFLKNIKN